MSSNRILQLVNIVTLVYLVHILGLLLQGCQQSPKPAEEVETSMFTRSMDEAKALAASSNKPIFVHIGADWCKPCRSLHKDVYPQVAVRDELQKFVLLELDMDHVDESHKEIIRSMKVNSIPKIAVFNSELKKVIGPPEVARAEATWILNYLQAFNSGLMD